MVLLISGKSDLCRLSGILFVVSFLILPLIQGCTAAGSSVIASTGTVIGVEISQNQTSQTPTATLGYKRAELAYVPTNRGTVDKVKKVTGADGVITETHEGAIPAMKDGARDSANVLMELRYVGIFDVGSASGIYQRLAVGDKAVAQPGASLMFAKNDTGKVDATAAGAIGAAQQNLMAGLSPADWQTAVDEAKKRAAERRPKIDIIADSVKSAADKSLVDSTKLQALVDKALLDKDDVVVKQLLKLKKTDDLKDYLAVEAEKFVDPLLKAAVG